MSKLWIYSTLMLTSSVYAGDFIDNSSVELTTRNFYFDRDYQKSQNILPQKIGHKDLFSKQTRATPREPLVLG